MTSNLLMNRSSPAGMQCMEIHEASRLARLFDEDDHHLPKVYVGRLANTTDRTTAAQHTCRNSRSFAQAPKICLTRYRESCVTEAKAQLGADPNVMARSLAGAMRPHHVLAHVETGLPKPFAEGAIRARRPDRQHAARAQRSASGSQSGGAV